MRPMYFVGPKSRRPHLDEARSHRGLWYEKFCPHWPELEEFSGMDAASRRAWLSEIVSHPVGEASLLEEHRQRQAALLARLGGQQRILQTRSPLLPGSGLLGSADRGLLWHSVLGCPYLPASSLKGVMRRWASDWEGAAVEEVERLFGASDRGAALMVFDALPLEPVTLTVESRAASSRGYHRGEAIEAPRPWESPESFDYLVVAPGERFVISCAPAQAGAIEEGDWARIWGWFGEALEWMGIGAQGSLGYGRGRLLVVNATGEEAAQDPKVEALEDEGVEAAEEVEAEAVEAEAVEALEDEALEDEVDEVVEAAEAVEGDDRALGWLAQALEAVAQERGGDEEDALKSVQLAERWDLIEDESLRDEVLALIRARWDEQGWLENRRIGARFRKRTYAF